MSELRKRRNLLIGGLQIQNRKKRGIGTLGCIVFDQETNKPLGLSNKHILRKKIGSSVIQPAVKARTSEFIVGNVFRKSDKYDCTVFEVNESYRDYDKKNSLYGLNGKIIETVDPVVGMKVQKIGQYTGHTYGIVKKLLKNGSFTIVPNPDKKVPEISQGGDSGALWVTDEINFKAVGLHTGGEKDTSKRNRPDKAWAIKINLVLEDLKIKF